MKKSIAENISVKIHSTKKNQENYMKHSPSSTDYNPELSPALLKEVKKVLKNSPSQIYSDINEKELFLNSVEKRKISLAAAFASLLAMDPKNILEAQWNILRKEFPPKEYGKLYYFLRKQ